MPKTPEAVERIVVGDWADASGLVPIGTRVMVVPKHDPETGEIDPNQTFSPALAAPEDAPAAFAPAPGTPAAAVPPGSPPGSIMINGVLFIPMQVADDQPLVADAAAPVTLETASKQVIIDALAAKNIAADQKMTKAALIELAEKNGVTLATQAV